MDDTKCAVEKAFQTTFKIIFGECNVTLDELEDYLWRYLYPIKKRKSAFSEKDIFLCHHPYCEGAKMISQDEENMDINRKFEPLDINKIKDIDSIINEIKDRIYYAGNRRYGVCDFVEKSDAIVDSFYIYNSHFLNKTKYIGYSSCLRDGSEHAFGSALSLRIKYVIKTAMADKITRSFETYLSTNSSDLFFCYDCRGSNHLMFSFNIRSKNYCIGNLELPKDKYMVIRKKLIDESREHIEKYKTFYSIFESLPPIKVKPMITVKDKPVPPRDFKPIEEAWKSTCRIVLGKDIGPLQKYERLLSERINPIKRFKTICGNETCSSDLMFYKYIPKERYASSEESEEVAKQHITFEDGEEISLKSIIEKISPIAFFKVEIHEGNTTNYVDTQNDYNAINTYKTCDGAFVKNIAYNSMVLNSEYIFGSYRISYSKFCIKSNGVNISCCFDVASCINSSNLIYCYDVEGLDNCMFCFNTKAKRYAIGNVEIGKENYMKIKKLVLDEITAKLEKDGTLPFDIFTIACYNPNSVP
ncbi:MAG: hypothetical protein AB1391_02235 [Candidatus Micrarchaeota archaeon]